MVAEQRTFVELGMGELKLLLVAFDSLFVAYIADDFDDIAKKALIASLTMEQFSIEELKQLHAKLRESFLQAGGAIVKEPDDG